MIVQLDAYGRLLHFEHQLAAEMPRLADAERLRGLGQRKHASFRHTHRTCRLQMNDALEMRAIAADCRAQGPYVRARRGRSLGTRSDESNAPARSHDRERALCHLAADRLEDRVDVLHHAGEVVLVVVDDLIGAEALDVSVVDRARGGDDTGTNMLGELDGKSGDATGAALNENGFAVVQLDRILDCNERRPSLAASHGRWRA